MWDALASQLREQYQLAEGYRVAAVSLELTAQTRTEGDIAELARDKHEGELGFCEAAVEEAVLESQERVLPPQGFVFVTLRATAADSVVVLVPEADVKGSQAQSR